MDPFYFLSCLSRHAYQKNSDQRAAQLSIVDSHCLFPQITSATANRLCGRYFHRYGDLHVRDQVLCNCNAVGRRDQNRTEFKEVDSYTSSSENFSAADS